MGDSSPEEITGEENWILYKDRPEWNDVKPLPQDDGPFPVVMILYSDKFRDIYDYFRAVLKSGEKSERALKLTEDALTLNPANYTVWQYRREILKHLKKDLKAELDYVKNVIDVHTKNYQVWHHRRIIIEWLGNPEEELDITADVLTADAKNYHAWQHRQWVIQNFGLFDEELEYVNQLITEDIRNNSAWNQRYFVINHTSHFTPDVIEREVRYTINKIKLVSKNESSWNYLRGVLFHSEHGLNHPSAAQFCEELYEQGNRSPYLLAYLVDLTNEKIEQGGGDKADPKERALKLCRDLAENYDRIRRQYWRYVARSFQQPTPEN